MLLMTVAAGCQGPTERREPVIPALWHSAAEANASIEQHLKTSEGFRQQIIQVQGQRTVENTLAPYNYFLIEIESLTSPSELMANAHPYEAVRRAADIAYKKSAGYFNDINMARRLCEALKQVPADGLDSETQRFLIQSLLNYCRAGAGR